LWAASPTVLRVHCRALSITARRRINGGGDEFGPHSARESSLWVAGDRRIFFPPRAQALRARPLPSSRQGPRGGSASQAARLCLFFVARPPCRKNIDEARSPRPVKSEARKENGPVSRVHLMRRFHVCGRPKLILNGQMALGGPFEAGREFSDWYWPN